jgi:mevalonate kinase
MLVEATAPGKIILFGEHSVVYRGPAIVVAIDRRAKVIVEAREDKKIFIDANDLGFSGYFENDVYYPVRGKVWRGRNLTALNVAARKTMEHLGSYRGVNVKVRSMIPLAVGLGSSAAVSVATVAAIGKLLEGDLTRQEISELAYEGEKVIHGNPSGVDNTVASFGGIISYEKSKGIKHFELDEEPLPFVLGNTQKKRSTRKMVERVNQIRDRNPEVVDRIIDNMGNLAREGLKALLELDLNRIGDLMNINHGLLCALDVSTFELDALVHSARLGGALGAKITGAGGGGCIIALAEESSLARIERYIRRRRGQSLRVKLTEKGVEARMVESNNS